MQCFSYKDSNFELNRVKNVLHIFEVVTFAYKSLIMENYTNNSNYIIECLSELKILSLSLIRHFGFCKEYDKHDLINSAYAALGDKSFESKSHFQGSMYKAMKFLCFVELRKIKRNVEYNTDWLEGSSDCEVSENNIDESVKKAISNIKYEKYQKMLNLAGQGYAYDLIADELGIDRKNIRFQMFNAKRILRENLAKEGIIVENKKQIAAYVTNQFKSDRAELYNDFPIDSNKYRDAIKFVLSKCDNKISRLELLSIVSKNKGKPVENCRTAFNTSIKKLKNDGEITLIEDVVSWNHSSSATFS